MQNLYDYQRTYIPQIGMYGPLSHHDIVRLSYGLDSDIFRTNACVGYCGSIRRDKKYVVPLQFSYEGHKVPLNRLLYHNYIEDIEPGDNIVNTCKYKGGLCCNIRHITKRPSSSSTTKRRTAKLTEAQVIGICQRLVKGDAVTTIANDYGVSRMAINNIRTGKSHRAISDRNIKKNEKNENV